MKDYDHNSVDRRNNVIFIDDILAVRELQEKKLSFENTENNDIKFVRTPAYVKIIASVSIFMAALHLTAFFILPDYGRFQEMHIFSLWIALASTFILSLMSLYSTKVGNN